MNLPRRRPIPLMLVTLAVVTAATMAAYAGARGAGHPAAAAPAATSAATAAGRLRIIRGGLVVAELTLPARPQARRRALRRLVERLPARQVRRRGPARIVYYLDRQRLLARATEAVARGSDAVAAPQHAVAAAVRVPLFRQALRNNCETAALSMLLAAANIRVSQLELQRQLPHSGPLDPRPVAGGLPIWGDPDHGFVGRAAGGGTSGGFGVYPQPLQALALRHGVRLRNLTRASAAAVYRQLLAGRPAIAWVGLSAGPYKSWQTPSGRRITVNFGEHTVVLTGIRGDRLQLDDPLSGRRLSWTKAQFVQLWNRLGRRTLALTTY